GGEYGRPGFNSLEGIICGVKRSRNRWRKPWASMDQSFGSIQRFGMTVLGSPRHDPACDLRGEAALQRRQGLAERQTKLHAEKPLDDVGRAQGDLTVGQASDIAQSRDRSGMIAKLQERLGRDQPQRRGIYRIQQTLLQITVQEMVLV